MVRLVGARLLQAAGVLLTVALIAFVMFSVLGDPVTIMMGQSGTEAEHAALRARLGLDAPLFVQYGRFVWAALHGEFGVSYRLARPVTALIGERLPATVELACCATLLALVIGVPLGVLTARRRRGWSGRLMTWVILAGSLIGVSLPTFLIGILLILVFSVWLRWLPSFGRGEVVRLGFWSTGLLTRSGMRALILPSVTLALFQATLILRLVRAEVARALQSEAVRFARARGITGARLLVRHGLGVALVPLLTIAALQFGSLIAFSVVTETVFQWPGMGLLLVQSIEAGDLPVLGAYLLLTGAVFVAINLGVDIACLLIDPRLREGGMAPR